MSENIVLEMFVIFIVILFSPILSRLLKIPVIVLETLLGILLGPSFLSILEAECWLLTIALVGFIYLMFVVGLEVELRLLRRKFSRVIAISLGSFLVPLTVGYFVGLYYGLPPEFIGVALSTTSMGVVLPTVKEYAEDNPDMAQTLLGAAILVDVISMLALAYVIEREYLSPDKLVFFVASVLGIMIAIAILKEWKPVKDKIKALTGAYHLDVRLCIALIFGFAALAEFTGIHAIIGAFAAGLIVSELEEKVEGLLEKLLGFGYGFFIPIFFIAVGIRTDLRLVFGNIRGLEILGALLLAGFTGKIAGTYFISRVSGFSKSESLSMGFAMSARLSLIIAAAELGLTAGLIDQEIYSILVLLAIASVLLSPTLSKLALGRKVPKIPEEIPIP
ncbi:MAG TPA: cation:proton antiporter [Thermoprotei archaeon]|nr:cation:proton antiporter [Thermoprotei archaeon]